jgi:hypothetical protein
MSFHEQSKSGLRIALAPLVSDLQACKVLALERLEKALDLPSKLVKRCHSQADKGPGNRKGLRKVRSSFKSCQTLSQPGANVIKLFVSVNYRFS